MRVLFTSTSGLGHLLPLLPIATACFEAGHEVVVATPAVRADRVRADGLAYAEIGAPTAADRAALRERFPDDPIGAANEIFGSLNPRTALPAIEEIVAGWRPDVVVSESAEFAGGLVAEAAGLPWIRVHPGRSLTLWEELVASTLDVVRVERGLASDPAARWLLDRRQLSAFPAGFDGAGERERLITRYRMPDLPVPGSSRDLVYVTFGTEIAGQPSFPELARACAGAAHSTGLKVVLSIAHADRDALGDLGDTEVETWVDHRELLPRAAAVVCHAGSGTLLGALASATPVVAVPFFADQPHNAERLVETGCGVAVQPGPRLTERVGAGLVAVLGGTPGSAAVAAEIAALPDIGTAVAAISSAAAGAGIPSAPVRAAAAS